MSLPVFHLLAGPNGAGKSTLFRALVASGTIGKEVEFVNADLYERDHLQHIADLQERSEAARVWADGRRDELLQAGQGVVSETVFSHDSKLSLIIRAQGLGFSVVLHVVSVDDPTRLVARVNQRVEEGGHNVPADESFSAIHALWSTSSRRFGWLIWSLSTMLLTLSTAVTSWWHYVKESRPRCWLISCRLGL